MKTTLMLSVLVLLMVGMFGMGERVEAKSVTWSSGGSYGWFMVDALDLGDGFVEFLGGTYNPTFANVAINVTYIANMYNDVTTALIPDAAVVPVGTKVRFKFEPVGGTNASWFAMGSSDDSPYAYWDKSYVVDQLCLYGSTFNVYSAQKPWMALATPLAALNINSPTVTYSHGGSTAGLSCNGSGSICTVTSAGTILTSVNMSSANATFALQQQPTWWGCINFTWMKLGYVIPAQTIALSLTAIAANNPPTAPIITPQPFSGLVSTSHTFNFTGTDPDAGNTIRYQIDWNNDGFVDITTATPVSSGTTQSSSYSWPTAGVKTFKARTLDNNGSVSAWTTANATINNPVAPTVVTHPAVGNTIHGTGNPNNGATTGWFRYATTDPGSCNDIFGTRAPLAGGTALGAGSAPMPFSQSLTTAPATTYYYCAIASNAGGTGYGTMRSFLTTPATPTGLTATPDATCSSGSINITWNASTGATSYELEIDGVPTIVGTTYSHTGLANASTHTYRIRANNAGGSSAWSAPVNGTTAAACPLPDLTPLSFTATVPSTGGTFFDGETIVLNGTTTNIGTLATTLAFDDNFSYRWNGTGAWTNITPYTNHPAGFAVNATGIDNATLNPSGSGNLHIQYCVDSNNSILESDELNCMEQNFTVHPKPTGTLTVTSPIPYNTKSTIGWTTNSPTACTPRVTGGVDAWNGPSGSQLSSFLTSDTLYSLACAPYPGVLDSKLVDVDTEPYIKANPRIVEKGNPTTINWGTGTEVNCSILANGTVVNAMVTGLGSRTDVINARTTYTIDCPVIDQSVMVEVQGYGTET